MKKYVIMYADGRQQNIMQSVYESRKEAGESMMNFIHTHNENCDADNYLSPFDFSLEEVEYLKVNETITDFERARKALGLESNVDFELLGCFDKSDDICQLITDTNPKHIEALIALNKLFTIAQAWNKEDKFVPNFSNQRQDKWMPWFDYDKNTARFRFMSTFNTPTSAYNSGSRLCFKTSERAAQFGKQFIDLYNKIFL